MKLDIYTDGSEKNGNGGWGVAIYFEDKVKEVYGGEKHTTNNRMELTATIKAMESLLNNFDIDLYVDSDYVLRGYIDHLPKWKANGWNIMNKNSPVKNVDLWKRLDALTRRHNITWKKVKAHSGNVGNTLADELPDLGRESLNQYSKIGEIFTRTWNME